MAAKHDAVINELNFKIDKLIKLYISSLEQNKSLESKIQDLQSELENLQRENKVQFRKGTEVMKRKCESTNWCGR